MTDEFWFTLLVGAVVVYLVHMWTRPLNPIAITIATPAPLLSNHSGSRGHSAADASAGHNDAGIGGNPGSSEGSDKHVSSPKATASTATATVAPIPPAADASSTTNASAPAAVSSGGSSDATAVCAVKLLCGSESRVVTVLIDADGMSRYTIGQLKIAAFHRLQRTSKVTLIFHGQRLNDSLKLSDAPFARATAASPASPTPTPTTSSSSATDATTGGSGGNGGSGGGRARIECFVHAFFSPALTPNSSLATHTVFLNAETIATATAAAATAATASTVEVDAKADSQAAAPLTPAELRHRHTQPARGPYGADPAYAAEIEAQAAAQARAGVQPLYNPFGQPLFYHAGAANASANANANVGADADADADAGDAADRANNRVRNAAAAAADPLWANGNANGNGGGGDALANGVPKAYVTLFAVLLAFLGVFWGLYFAAGSKLFGPSSVAMLSLLTGLYVYCARITRVFE